MIAQSDAIVDSALAHSWEAAVVAILVLGAMTFLGWFFRFMVTKSEEREKALVVQAQSREDRLAARITSLESFINDRLIGRLESNTTAMTQLSNAISTLTVALSTRPCLIHDAVNQDAIGRVLEELKKTTNVLNEPSQVAPADSGILRSG